MGLTFQGWLLQRPVRRSSRTQQADRGCAERLRRLSTTLPAEQPFAHRRRVSIGERLREMAECNSRQAPDPAGSFSWTAADLSDLRLLSDFARLPLDEPARGTRVAVARGDAPADSGRCIWRGCRSRND